MILFRKPVPTFRDHARAGFTLIEVVVALALVAVALTAIRALIATTIRGTRAHGDVCAHRSTHPRHARPRPAPLAGRDRRCDRGGAAEPRPACRRKHVGRDGGAPLAYRCAPVPGGLCRRAAV